MREEVTSIPSNMLPECNTKCRLARAKAVHQMPRYLDVAKYKGVICYAVSATYEKERQTTAATLQS